MKYRYALLIVLLIIVADQCMKFYIKTHFYDQQHVDLIGSWCQLHFLENEGMAFGMKISQTDWGKLVLTLFRLIAVCIGFFLLKRLVIRQYSKGLIICGALILAGAMGNLIDSMFYGLIFTDSHYAVAQLVPWGHGYGRFLHGRVVDMFYFPITNIHFPKWLPIIGDKYYEFFADVFNVADASISIGVLTLIFFQKRLLKHKKPTPPEQLPTTEVPAT